MLTEQVGSIGDAGTAAGDIGQSKEMPSLAATIGIAIVASLIVILGFSITTVVIIIIMKRQKSKSRKYSPSGGGTQTSSGVVMANGVGKTMQFVC